MADWDHQYLHEMIQELINDMILDAIGVAEWKKSRAKIMENDNQYKQYGMGKFPSDSGSPLSTFSSTPPAPTFEELKGEGSTDDKNDSGTNIEPPENSENLEIVNKTDVISEIKQDKDLMNYLIGPVSDSDVETNQNDSNDLPDTNSMQLIKIIRMLIMRINCQ